MFTGIIEAIGKIVKYDRSGLWVKAPFRGIRLGESISVDGVCLTVRSRRGRHLAFDVGPETARITTLGQRKVTDSVNLERSLRVGDRLGGHWVSGHVEKRVQVVRVEKAGANRWIYLRIPKSLSPFVRSKGSLAVDGISLTVAALRGPLVKIMVIPHTLKKTTLGTKSAGHWVNVEADLLAKYAKRRRN